MINPRTNNVVYYTKDGIKTKSYVSNLVLTATISDIELEDDDILKLCKFIESDDEKHNLLFFPIVFNESKRNMNIIMKRFTNLINRYFISNYLGPRSFSHGYLIEYLISQYLILRLFKNHDQSINFLVKHIQKPLISKIPNLESAICDIMQNISVIENDYGPYIISQNYNASFDNKFSTVLSIIVKTEDKILSYETNKLYHDMICRFILKHTRKSDYSSAPII